MEDVETMNQRADYYRKLMSSSAARAGAVQPSKQRLFRAPQAARQAWMDRPHCRDRRRARRDLPGDSHCWRCWRPPSAVRATCCRSSRAHWTVDNLLEVYLGTNRTKVLPTAIFVGGSVVVTFFTPSPSPGWSAHSPAVAHRHLHRDPVSAAGTGHRHGFAWHCSRNAGW
jgi:hypothetical protein